jgi:hypothetical protein
VQPNLAMWRQEWAASRWPRVVHLAVYLIRGRSIACPSASYTARASTPRGSTCDGAWANLYLVVRRAASAHHLSFPYAGKDFVLCGRIYSQAWRSGERQPNPGPPAAGRPFPTRQGISGDRLRLKTGVVTATRMQWRLAFSRHRPRSSLSPHRGTVSSPPCAGRVPSVLTEEDRRGIRANARAS